MKNEFTIGILEDDAFFGNLIKDYLQKRRNWKIKLYRTIEELENDTEVADAYVFDYMLAFSDEINTSKEALVRLRKKHPDIPVIYFTNYKEIDIAMSLIKLGASDYLLKDNNSLQELMESLDNVLTYKSLETETLCLDKRINRLYKRFGSIVSTVIVLAGLLYYLIS